MCIKYIIKLYILYILSILLYIIMDEIISQIDTIDISIDDFSRNIYDLINPENIKTYNILRKDDSFRLITEEMDIDDLNISVNKNICKKETRKYFDDITTNVFFTEDNQDNIFRFQYLVNNLFNKMIIQTINYLNENTPEEKRKLLNTDIIFLYKGGTTLKIIYDKYKDIFKDTNNDRFFEELKQFFKRSDSDYVIMINPIIDVRLNYAYSFEYIYALICYRTTNLLNLIRRFIKNTYSMEQILKKSNITLDILQRTLEGLNNTIQQIKRDERKSIVCNKYRNVDNVIGISYINSNNEIIFFNPLNIVLSDEEKEEIKNKLTGNNTIITSDNYVSNKINPDISDINLSINNNVNVILNKNIASFCLQRLKVNFVAIFDNISDRNKIIKNYPGELIDIVIFKQNSTALNNFYSNLKEEYTRYTYRRLNTELKYRSYSIDAHLLDLIYILFGMSEYPWNDNKYINRLNRMTFFIIINFYNSFTDVTDFERFLTKFKSNIMRVINNIIKMDRELKTEFRMEVIPNEFIVLKYKEKFEVCKTKNKKLLEDLLQIKNHSIIVLITELIKLNNKIIIYSDIIEFKEFFKNLFQKISLFRFENLLRVDDVLSGHLQYLNLEGTRIKQLGGNYKEKYLKYKQKYLQLKKS